MSVYLFVCEYEELSVWRLDVFSRGDFDFEWLVRVCVNECFCLARFPCLAMNNTARLLQDYIRICAIS